MPFLLLILGWFKNAFSWLTANPAWAAAIVAAVVIGWQHVEIKHDAKTITTDKTTITAYKTQLAQAVTDNKSNVVTIGQLKNANTQLANDLAIQKTAVATANAAIAKINANLSQSISTARNILHDTHCTQGNAASPAGFICAAAAERLRQLDAALPH